MVWYQEHRRLATVFIIRIAYWPLETSPRVLLVDTDPDADPAEDIP